MPKNGWGRDIGLEQIKNRARLSLQKVHFSKWTFYFNRDIGLKQIKNRARLSLLVGRLRRGYIFYEPRVRAWFQLLVVLVDMVSYPAVCPVTAKIADKSLRSLFENPFLVMFSRVGWFQTHFSAILDSWREGRKIEFKHRCVR